MFVATPESTQIVNVSLSEADILKVPELPGRPRNAVAALRAWRHGALAAMGPVDSHGTSSRFLSCLLKAAGLAGTGGVSGAGAPGMSGVGNPLVLVGTVQKR